MSNKLIALKDLDDLLCKYKVEDLDDLEFRLKNAINQDNISFAVERLEKVKESFFDISNGWWLCFRDGTQYMTHDELDGCVRDVIDNQIKELKGGK